MQRPNDHLSGYGCPYCAGKMKSTTEEFIKKAKTVHRDEFDYSNVEYKNINTKVKIKHNKCGNVFEQTPGGHLNGNGCDYCGGTMKLTTSEFIKKAKIVHGNEFDYDNVFYFNNSTKVNIIHNKCKKMFGKTPDAHLRGGGCPYCSGKMKLTTEEFINKAKVIHGDEFDYNNVSYVNGNQKVQIKHNKCGKYFEQTPHGHLSGNGCDYCKQSKMEKVTEGYLIEKNIVYEIQKRFENCRDKYPLPFDFYLPELNVLIECQGIQHYMPISSWNRKDFTKEQALEDFEDRIKKDAIKREYANNNGCKLIEISYKEQKRIPEILDAVLKDVVIIQKEPHQLFLFEGMDYGNTE